MLEDIEYILGDPQALRGRSIIYTTNISGSENPFNPANPALAVAADPSDLAEILSSIIPFPDEIKGMLNARIKEMSDMWTRTMFGQKMYETVKDLLTQGLSHIALPEDLKKQMEEEMRSIPDEATGVPHHGFFVPLVGFDPDVLEPFQDTVDLLKAPDVPNISYAGLVLTGHAQHYLAHYLLQSEEEADREAPGVKPTTPNVQEIPKEDFLAILKKKVSELMYVQETGGNAEQLVSDLIQLTKGTFFVRDVLNITRIAQSDREDRVHIIELLIKRIHLLAEERYEEVPALDQELAALDPRQE